ncbi:hypothetical protein JKY79_03070 [Candidatus Babeliales bacterium]|nr:hypothetical protein [Candidatus Babeliales bacterium]
MAIIHVGGSKISSITEDSTEAIACEVHYDAARDKVLADKDWTFATSRAEIAQNAVNPIFGYQGSFTLPSDCLRVMEVWESADDMMFRDRPNPLEWEREENNISADTQGSVFIRYIKRVEVTSRYSAGFVDALSHYLAYKLAIPLAQSKSLQTDMMNLYLRSLKDAANADGLQGRSKRIRSSSLVNARLR